jgi:ribonucleoside-diphosphate reductase alpha chain
MDGERKQNELSRRVWAAKYRFRGADGSGEVGLADTWDRVASALASVERGTAIDWRSVFRGALDDFRFLPAGRILAGAGTGRHTTLANCFVMDFIDDSIDGIFERLKQSAVTMQWGGGIGCDFSTLRPRGTPAAARGTIASGPVSFMRVWDAMCATLLSTGARRGAMMGTLRCDHPDIETFIDAKREAGALRNFNLSVQVTDAFMAAVAADDDWPLVFPAESADATDTITTAWPGRGDPCRCRVWRRVEARELWRRIMDAAYDTAEPGVLFVDRINRANNLRYCERLTSTNPCGEIPLPANGACTLGSLNLTAFVERPFSTGAQIDLHGIEAATRVAVRMLDDSIDVSGYPLVVQAQQARATRRIGLGVTGLGDALIMLGLRYDSDGGRAAARVVLQTMRDAAYGVSTELAEEKGAFPVLERDEYLDGEFVRELPGRIRDRIARSGIRNSHLLAIAPTGTISLLANNLSSGIEPVFALRGERRVLGADGEPESCATEDYAYGLWQRALGGQLPAYFVTADDLDPEAHLSMVAALQPFVDNSISKTINVTPDIDRSAFASIYGRAYELGLKGCTVFRPNSITGAVLTSRDTASAVHCCTPDREAD